MPLAVCKLEKKTRKSKWDVVFVNNEQLLGVYQFIMVGISESKSFILAQTAKKKGQSEILWL